MLASECSSTAPFSKLVNMRRRPAISSSIVVLPSRARRHALKGCPGGDRPDHFAASLARDIAGATRHGAHEPWAKRLANRRAAYAGIGGKLVFVEADFGAAAD